MVRTCSEIVAELVAAVEAGKDINLNGLKNRASRRNKLQHQPKLVEIIAAIPEQHKAALLPKLKAKPVRTASGVSKMYDCTWITIAYSVYLVDCCCSCHV